MTVQALVYDTIRLGDIEVDFKASRIRSGQGEQIVEPKILDVLRVLADRQGQVVTREELIDQVWGVKVGGDERLTRSISLLRKAVGDRRGEHRHIETIPKRGYRLITGVLPDGPQPVNDAPAEPLNLQPAPTTIPARSIAVLPFFDLSPEKDQNYLVEGVAEEILNALNRVDDLQVTGRNSAFLFNQETKDVPKIAAILNVAYVLTGSLRVAGGRLQLTVQLVEGKSNQQLWSANYERYLDDIFDLQEEIVQSVLEQMGKVFNIGPVDRLAQRLTTSPEAYALFNHGRQLTHQLNGQRTIPTGIEYLTRAVELDENFAEAWAWLGLAHYILPEFSMTSNWVEHWKLSHHATERALAADPKSSMALLTRAMNLAGELKFDEAALAFERALILDPNNVEPLAGFSLILMGIGLPDVAEPYITQVIKQDPLCGIWHITYGGIHLMRGDLEQAEACFVRSYDLGFGSGALAAAECMARRGKVDEAVEFLTANVDGLAPVEQVSFRSRIGRHFACNAFLRHRPVSSKIVDLALRRRLNKPLAQPTSGITIAFLFLDDADAFIRHILEKPNPYIPYAVARIWEDTDPSAHVRNHPQFPTLIDRLGLERAWKLYGTPKFMA